VATRRGAISTDNWGVRLVDFALYPFALVATPAFLLFLMIFFIARAFADSSGSGVRSFSAVLLLMVLALLVAFKRENLKRAERVGNLWVFIGTLAIGLGVMELLRLTPTGVPASELVLSGSFSVLLFSSVSLSRDRAMFYYFGTILGFLSYVVLFGFPALR
jgi:hypothetical protein